MLEFEFCSSLSLLHTCVLADYRGNEEFVKDMILFKQSNCSLLGLTAKVVWLGQFNIYA